MAAPRKAALVCVDIQNDFCDDPDGALAVKGSRAMAPIWNDLLSMPFALKLATRDCHPPDHVSFASQHTGKEPFKDTITVPNPDNEKDEPFTSTLWPDHCIQGTHGCEIISELDQSKIQRIIDKGKDKRVESYSGFGPHYRNPRIGGDEMLRLLQENGITDVFTVGLAFEACVMHTSLDAAEYGFRTFLIEDASGAADKSEKNVSAVCKKLQDGGVALIRLDSKEVQDIKKAVQ
jgi:nicotinamidase-related amidase